MDLDSVRRELVVHKNEFSDVRVFHRVHDSMIEHGMLREYAREVTVAFTSLTAGGSEYFGRRIGELYTADVPFCLQHIRESKETLWDQFKNKTRRLKTAEARVTQLEGALAQALAALDTYASAQAAEIRDSVKEPAV